jgi:hypothetical protein
VLNHPKTISLHNQEQLKAALETKMTNIHMSQRPSKRLLLTVS